MKAFVLGTFLSFIALPGLVSHASDVVVVCPPEWRDAMLPWAELRRDQDLSLDWVAPAETAADTRRQVLKVADSATRYIVLVGDTPVFGRKPAPTQVPTFYRAARVTAAHGSTPAIPTDLPYADLDDDDLVDVALGRLPVQTATQLRRLVERIIRYERSSDFGPWRRCLQLTGGVGGFGELVDGAIESVTRGVLTSVLPIDAKPQIAYASPGHPFCPGERSFPDAVWDRYTCGSRFWVYAGHGSVDRLDILERAADDAAELKTTIRAGAPHGGANSGGQAERWTARSLLDTESAARLHCQPSRSPIGVLLACYAGATDARVDCLAERMVLAEGGPVAVIAASRLTMPYGNAKFGLGLLDAVYNRRVRRLGDATRSAIRPLQQSERGGQQAEGAGAGAIGWMIDGLAAMMSPAGSDLEAERREHAVLYQLLGDPLLSLRPPQPLSMTVQGPDTSENASAVDSVDSAPSRRRLSVTVAAPLSGKLRLSVDRPLAELPSSRAPASKTAPSEGLPGAVVGGADLVAELIDDPDPHGLTLIASQHPIDAGVPLVTKLTVPPGWSGPVVVRAFVEGSEGWASAAVQAVLP